MKNYNNAEEFERYQRAKQQVKELRGFYGHLISFICVMFFLMYLNLKNTPDHLWFLYPMGGWGLGLFFHAAKVFNWFPFLGKDWEQRKIQEYLEEEKKNQKKIE